jgi:hypothetical protein
LGSNEIIVSDNSFDLTQNSTGSPYGITVQSGGTGNPYNITICNNTFKTKAYSSAYPAITASSIVGLNISNNLFTNPNTGSKAAYFIDASASIVTGAGNTFYNPSYILHVDDNSFGTLTDSRIDGDLSAFAFLTGNSIGATSVCFDGFSIHRAFTAATSPTAQTMFPSGTCFDVTAGVRFVFNGSTVSWVTTVKLDWTGSALTVGTPKGAAAAGQAFPTAGQWTASGGNILAAATSNSTYAGNCLITVKGPYFP